MTHITRTPPPLPPRIDQSEINIVARGKAIAEVRALESRAAQLETQLKDLERELQVATDRMALLAEERTRYRRDAEQYRTWLIELASDMKALHLLSTRATETHERITSLISSETPLEEPAQAGRDSRAARRPVPPPSSAAEALRSLEVSLGTPAEDPLPLMFQTSPPADAGEHNLLQERNEANASPKV